MKIWVLAKCFFANLFPQNLEYLFRDALKELKLKPSSFLLLEHLDEDLKVAQRFLRVNYDLESGKYSVYSNARFVSYADEVAFSDFRYNFSEDEVYDRCFDRGYRICTRDKDYMAWLKASCLEAEAAQRIY